MTYEEAIDWLLSFADFERSGRFQDRPDVTPMLALLERLGNPHDRYGGYGDIDPRDEHIPDTVHIVGSKGKGTIAALVESILHQAGLRVGLYTSPHLHSYCERIRVAREPVSETRLAALAAHLRPAVNEERAVQSEAGRDFVTFDLLTALAFLEFADELTFQQGGRPDPVEVQVVEAGLGGRLDSTNVLEFKDIAVIAPISLEHTAILGDTVEQIAREKAAIITPRCTVVMAPQPYEAAVKVIMARREAVESSGIYTDLMDVSKEYSWQKLSHDSRSQSIRVEGPHSSVESALPLLGSHQIENAATAIATVDALKQRYFYKISPSLTAQGLASVRWPGRMEVLREHPLVICDGAHNRDSAQRLRETLVDYFACDRALLVIGCGSDKDIDGLAQELSPIASDVIAVRSNHPRAMAPERITEAFGRLNIDTEIGDSVGEAVDKAIAVGGERALICVAGSLFVAAEAREHFGLTTA
jgi:dihydrofolate synthase/folylpolyglutamate synthase